MHHVVFNPVAGRGRARAGLEGLVRLLEASGVEHLLHVTTGPGHAAELAAATAPTDVVVAVGGDGTVHEVVAGLLRAEGGRRVRSRALALVPLGSGDDFGHALGLPRGDVAAAVARIARGARRQVDLAFVNDAPFVNAFGTGFDAHVAHRLADAPAFLKGPAAYLYALLVSLGAARPAPVEVTLDGEVVFRGRSLLVAAQNGPRTGGSFLFAPDARVDDGLLDVVLAGDVGLAGTLALLPRVMRGRHLSHPLVRLHRGRRLAVSWSAPRYGHADGESAGEELSYVVELEPGALTVVA